jgi:hypothetical protein
VNAPDEGGLSPADRLRSLCERGAEAFDPEGYRLAARLVDAQLEARALLRIEKLEQELEQTKLRIEEQLGLLRERGVELGDAVAQAQQSGDLRTTLRLLLRLAAGRVEEPRSSSRWAAMLAARAQKRAVRLPEELAFRVDRLTQAPEAPVPQASELAHALSHAMFVDSIASSRATLAIARASDNVPEDSGPYNPQVIAARALAELAELSPSYAQAFVSGLDDLASLEGIPLPSRNKQSGRRRQ